VGPFFRKLFSLSLLISSQFKPNPTG
jgi:hypothetical protein